MEGLRALAALGVLAAHAQAHLTPDVSFGPTMPVMWLLVNGLTLFFGLSGFLLYRPFATALMTGDRFPALGRYAGNRALRIFPAYIVITLLVSLVLGVAYARPQAADEATRDVVGYMFDPGLLAINMTMLQSLFPFSIKTGLGVAWSLTVELVFYVVMPLLAIAFMSVRRRVHGRHGLLLALAPAAAIFLIGVVGKILKAAVFAGLPEGNDFYYEWGGGWSAVLARAFPTHADLFTFGMIAAVLIAAFENGVIRPQNASRFRWSAFAIAAVAAVATRFVPHALLDTTFAVVFGAVIFFVALPDRSARPGVLARGLELLPFRYVGLVSYSLYLWHLPVIWLVDRFGLQGPHTGWGLAWNILLVAVVSLTLASLTYWFVEKPALALKRRTDNRVRSTAHKPS
ncbi:acyltransferase family protein [Microbacterium trichothecenolyticum]